MSIITQITQEINESAIAMNVNRKYDDARISFQLTSNRVSSEDEFYSVLGEFYNHVHNLCVSPGSKLSPHEAVEHAIRLLEDAMRQEGGNIQTAYQNTITGINGGMMRLLDTIANSMRYQAQQLYTENVLRRYISPMQWEPKVDAIRALLAHYQNELPPDIDVQHPEKYANDYSRLIKGLVQRVNQTASEFRRY